ncbi:bifunctional DNA primase/polymerase [Frankia sp. Cas3]|uniref:bifunctional DNA primase/polymerase n=1 Tax=Frankia sp. Cas3 TaxID=3073926 RepID=UPI002AD33E0F|nr:bifunctional DNA primase/polymerase [Frankia sp. Cas3]
MLDSSTERADQRAHSDLKAAALGYARRGWPTFPLWWPNGDRCACGTPDCDRPAKHPIGRAAPRGLHSSTVDPDVIRSWWSRWPDANIGLRTGVHFDVIDLDGVEGLASLAAMDNAGYPPNILGIAETGREIGWHLFVPPSGDTNKTRFLPGLDYRGKSGYVVAAPSLHISGRRYRWCGPGGTR